MAKEKKANNKQEQNEVLEAEKQTATEEAVAEKEQENEQEQELSAEEKLAIELDEAKDKYLRLYSEFENFRRRSAKERIELISTASSDLIKELLPTIDDFERAKKANENQEDVAVLKEGFDLISSKLFKALESKGLKVMETEKGTDFDADLHEAVTQFPVEDESLKGKIIDTVEKGYYLGDKVIRFAKVVIGA
ncbi:nucleotide exchange factor GrpE [Roseivirga thermotolerans]|uniref:Protein GrpE n=1 Tax=Roseivirga thermotolerans TaxID=1758176 RepID=A0ABQ3I3Y5_9BACT|nr:nucleotide exchange factor GrpE [Roseivirga thermotolerans]GHE52424.1 protein GrpE [Roseivirga thermotolerans]